MNKILVIQNKRIGDVLIASTLANNLKKKYPDSHITYLVYDYTSGVLEGNPNIDRIWTVNDKELKKWSVLWRTIQEIRRLKFDAILDPYAKFQSRMMCLFSRVPVRVGFKRAHKKLKLPYYTTTVDFLQEASMNCGKALEDRMNMLKLGFDIENGDPQYKITLSAEEQIYAPSQEVVRPILMIGVLGSSPKKSLPFLYTSALINHITATYEASILFNYAPHQRDEAISIYEQCARKDRIRLDIYEDSIRGFIRLMNQCDLLVSNEGGSVHIAKALGKPTFTIYSPYIEKSHWNSFEDGKTHDSVHLLEEKPDLFKGYSRAARKAIEKDPEQMYRELTPELILQKMEPYLDRHLKRRTDEPD